MFDIVCLGLLIVQIGDGDGYVSLGLVLAYNRKLCL